MSGACSLLSSDVEMDGEQLMKRTFSHGDVVNGVVRQVIAFCHVHVHVRVCYMYMYVCVPHFHFQ